MPLNYQVRAHDSISSIAEKHGFAPQTLWNHPMNSSLRVRRPHLNMLLPDDEVYIPDKEIKEVTRGTDELHRFVKKRNSALFCLQLYNDGEPRSHQRYQLIVDQTIYEGITNSEGVLRHHISPLASTGKIILLPSQLTVELQFGCLHPSSESSGIRQRLNNLGFACDDSEDSLAKALEAFQHTAGLPPNGILDSATTVRLRDLHDTVCPFPDSISENNLSRAATAQESK